MDLVVDASALLPALLAGRELDRIGTHRLSAPALLWSELPSALHELRWRQEVSEGTADRALRRFLGLRLRREDDPGLVADAWALATELGWAKTYDAEYVALARSRGIPLLTLDRRLHRSAARVADVIAPDEL